MSLTSNFEQGAPGWRPVNLASSVTMNVLQNGPAGNAQSGSAFLRASTSKQAGSVAVDTTYSGLAPVSLGVFAWVRAPGPPVSGILTIWQLSPAGINNHPDTPFQAAAGWSLISNVLLITNPGTGPISIRVEFYMNTINANLDIDSVVAVVGQ